MLVYADQLIDIGGQAVSNYNPTMLILNGISSSLKVGSSLIKLLSFASELL